ncbi:circularly permuted type 2 ATP-grasp protein [Pseudoxanthomonas sp.]|uniref:circularly permuted type 2 ATP-grasp protein n=1 Tax=Pseudoxanthomonas sp. TaxID=1871049 RepID=UPI00258E249E|nr:circularly permuted type 2 ATP-grasp protein [Pseudoxanthomonas sp.]MCR6685897.1 circularly permuted type 2 ATP-grasp protein [Pseudoxanthomonas sp.]
MDWANYTTPSYDELIDADGRPRPAARPLIEYLSSLSGRELAERQAAADVAARVMGITFTVYSDGRNVDRTLPFDLIPRILDRREWQRTEAGLKQRMQALNLFIGDIYGAQRIVRDKVFPAQLLEHSVNFRAQCVGVRPPLDVWAHICGSDLVRDGDGTLYALEDNLRIPSGVSYMLENRMVAKRVFPELFETSAILPVDDYPAQLYDTLAALSPRPGDTPTIALLTPGVFNSAYFEHAYLAQAMGIELVEGSDLFVDDDDRTWMRTVYGPQRVDVVYRRVDDLFIDPEAFRPDSVLGVPGLIRSWRAGKVALANAPGAGVADDKVVFAYVPKMIRYYLDQEPILPNVPSYLCHDEADRRYVLEHLDELVVKPANESGGYGMLIGPRASAGERERFRALIQADPRNYMAQPTLSLSTAPIVTPEGPGARHIDLRPFILSREDTYVTTGGLTRVAMTEGSLVVNSSQGGGAKDTWVVDLEEMG